MSCSDGECGHQTTACCWFCEHANMETQRCMALDSELECDLDIKDPYNCPKFSEEKTDHYLNNTISPNDIEFYIKG